jgi:hypothetical protein
VHVGTAAWHELTEEAAAAEEAAEEAEEMTAELPLASVRSRARWNLAYTLLNNPSLIPLRGGSGSV